MESRTGLTLKMVGEDGNAFSILGRASRVMRQADCSQKELDEFMAEAKDGDYDHLLQTCIKWFDTE